MSVAIRREQIVHLHFFGQAFCIFAALASFLSSSTALVAAAATTSQDERFLRKIPLNFLKLLMESNACDPNYDDYESCENLVPSNFLRK